MTANGDGQWKLDLLDGSAWFSDWFAQRLSWGNQAKRSTFDDLRPFMAPAVWDLLLGQLRAHLERKTVLDIEFEVQIREGQTQWWRLRGAAELNDAGRPVRFAGTVSDVSAERNRVPDTH
jgi:PAS domain-containing protein